MAAAQEHPDELPSDAHSADEAAIDTVAHVRTALAEGHPVLGAVDALLADLCIGGEDSEPGPPLEEPTPVRRAELLSSHAVMVDRIRAHGLVHLATVGLSLALTRRRSEDRLTMLLGEDEDDHSGGERSSGAGAAAGDDEDESGEWFLTHAEHLLEREHEAVLNARLSTRTGDSRRRLGLALTAYIGMPRLLRSMLTGRLPFNRWEGLARKLKHLSLPRLRALDGFLADLDPRYSLGQFLKHAAAFLAQFETEPVLAARARTERKAWVEHLPDGLALHCMQGPAPLIEAFHAGAKSTASAIFKNQLTALSTTPAQNTEHAASGELPDLSDLSVADRRTVNQLIFDILIGSTPQTQTVLERVAADGETTERYRVDVALPDDTTVLRRKATVVITVPMTTLLGLDDRPGTIAGQPLPADLARTVAASSTTWYRMLTDPATGRVLDDVALKYEPDRATRLSVLGAWQTCTLPGCSRPAHECEIDHGVPFDHAQPARGGRTEPANLHPLCPSHHQAKTEGRIRMRRTGRDQIEWLLPLGTTATSVAPSVDDGGILTAACAPTDSAARQDARRTIEERQVRDPVTHIRASDAAFHQAGQDFLAAERAREERQAARTAEVAPIIEQQIQVRRWAKETTQHLERREDRVRDREQAARARERSLDRDERHASLLHSEVRSRMAEVERREEATRTAESMPAATAGSACFRTIIPMRTKEFDLGNGRTSSLHTPIFFGARPLGEEEIASSQRPPVNTPAPHPQKTSLIDEAMSTAIYDVLAARQLYIDHSHVSPNPTLRPRPKPRATDGSDDDGFNDGEPPF